MDYVIDTSFNQDFPDLEFIRSSKPTDKIQAEVVQVTLPEEEKAREGRIPDSLLIEVKQELEKMGCKEICICFNFNDPPLLNTPQVKNHFKIALTSYIYEKIQTLSQKSSSFDRTNDDHSFWKNETFQCLNFIEITLNNSKKVSLIRFLERDPEIKPVEYIVTSIKKKCDYYAPSSVSDIILILDCDFLLVDLRDMEDVENILADDLKRNLEEINLDFSQVWCVNDVIPEPIVKQLYFG